MVWAIETPPDFAAAGGGDRGGDPAFTKNINVSNFTLPKDLGSVTNSYAAGKPDKVVIHIQDAHCNYAAQRQISKIIEYVNKEYGVVSVNLEGGAKGYDLSAFAGISDKAVKNKVADYFVKEGLVNGAEYFAINNPGKTSLWGVEDTKLYIDGLAVYRNSIVHKEEIEKYLKSLSHIISNLKAKIYSRELLDFDMKYGAHKANNMELKEYLSYLLGAAKTKGIDTKKLTNIYLLDQAFAREADIDFKKANKERDDLIDSLRKKLSKNAVEELVVKTLKFKQERISQKNFYAYLMANAKKSGIDTSAYPELQRYIAYISIYNAMDEAKVMEEKEKLEDAVKGVLCRNDEEKELSVLSKNLTLLKNIFDISLAKDDYRYYLANKDSFDVSRYAAFIDKEAPLHKITAALDKDALSLDRYREDISKFYDYSLKRDEAFLKNIKYAATGNNKQAAILVTGGFHNENLAEMFRKEGIAYVSIMPNFKNAEGYECPYFKILSGKESNLVASLDEALGTMQVASPYNALGVAVDERAAKLARLLPSMIAYAEENGAFAILTTAGDYLVLDKINGVYHFSREATSGNRKIVEEGMQINTHDMEQILRVFSEIGAVVRNEEALQATAAPSQAASAALTGAAGQAQSSAFDGIIPLLEAPKIDRVALVRAMADRTKNAEEIQNMLSAVETLPIEQRPEAQMAIRTAVAVIGAGDLVPGHLNIVVQCAGLGDGNAATNYNRKIEDILSRRYNGTLTKSIIGEDVNDAETLGKLLGRAIKALDSSKDPENSRALLFLPQSLKDKFEQAAKEASIMKDNVVDGRFKVQFVDQGAMPDYVNQFILGLEMLEYARNGAKPNEASQRLINLLAVMADGQDPQEILKKLFEFDFTLKIRKIDWRKIEEQRKAWEAVATAL
jgi:hypothetical protein